VYRCIVCVDVFCVCVLCVWMFFFVCVLCVCVCVGVCIVCVCRTLKDNAVQ